MHTWTSPIRMAPNSWQSSLDPEFKGDAGRADWNKLYLDHQCRSACVCKVGKQNRESWRVPKQWAMMEAVRRACVKETRGGLASQRSVAVVVPHRWVGECTVRWYFTKKQSRKTIGQQSKNGVSLLPDIIPDCAGYWLERMPSESNQVKNW